MGGSQSSEKTTEILNSTSVSTALKNVNESINEMTMKIVQENLMRTAAGAKVKQEVSIEGVKATGDITISGVTQSTDVQISVSSLTNTDMKQELVNDTMNELQTKLTETMKLTQEQALKQGEQMISGLINALADTMKSAGASLTGTNLDSKESLSLQNLLDIKSETELVNKVKNAVSSELVNKTVNEISNQLVGEQTVSIKDAETSGAIAITNIKQDMLSKQILDAISNVGTSNEIMSKLSNASTTEIAKSVEAGQAAEQEQQGTISAAGDFVTAVGDAATSFLNSGVLAILLPILIIGGFLAYTLRGSIGRSMEQQAGVQGVQYVPMPMTGGAKPFKGLMKKAMNMFSTIQKTVLKYGKKYITRKNAMIIGVSLIVIAVIALLYRKIRYTRVAENFTNEDKLSDLIMSSNGKYVSNKKLGGTKMCLKSEKERAFKFDVSITDKDIYIVHMMGTEKLYMKSQDGEIVLENYDFSFDKLYKFQHEKTGDKTYKLKQGEEYIILTDECLVMGPKDKAATFKFE